MMRDEWHRIYQSTCLNLSASFRSLSRYMLVPELREHAWARYSDFSQLIGLIMLYLLTILCIDQELFLKKPDPDFACEKARVNK